ncbi:hypothetical protein HRW18_03820 [Streptomyces lunaelactis]|uniref:DUF6415 family natural product biosynthesis protein n=1 Tax=Streptomyces lunaelactis TaxID=1535768 RepID=UPI0015844A5E|nr:DUF6415 family natural product biosynthesis protein [Streptomyces lunaelactis]NUK07152.1 hypothetical protein [Streptomyces lunaelactis]NUK55970.1 hypothetical protein [Streptomyces lunaelactis]NUL09502.1 hypothetical protein [Streptomyces lunaelactis]NUL22022.1 hypothetical protein [Streptomyces lunaelactis]
MARHAKRRASFSLVPRGLTLRGSADRRESGSAWGHALSEPGFAVAEEVQPDTDLLLRFLDAMRRQQAEERGSGPEPTTAEAIQQTADYVLSRHLDTAQDGELDATLLTLQGYLTALAQEAEAQLDTGRVVVREILSRARALADEECRPSQKCARHAAQTARDLLALLSREGWGTASTARVAQGHGR